MPVVWENRINAAGVVHKRFCIQHGSNLVNSEGYSVWDIQKPHREDADERHCNRDPQAHNILSVEAEKKPTVVAIWDKSNVPGIHDIG